MNGHREGKKFIPHNDSKKSTSSKSINQSTTGGDEMKGLPKSFKGYDVMKRKKVTVTKGIHKITMKNGRTALQGTSPLSGNTITHIIG
ncbi:MAG: hypothetical protein K5790_10580 [Nitrosopumilus sp.]|uniref:hypothetical protein n=1 Tax=Nitrosopumilus sp. TaxID=2024843 RepID=UPI00247C6BC6|nr:hypothetical protein [Nitrosopumilus sp.]MCV0393716.1 hypothetical protein [Nitrosopumilus sp.]